MNMWKYYLGRNDFDEAVDHAAIPHIMKSKNLSAMNRIIRLLEALSYFTFHLYYVKGKDMILCDFLSQIQVDDGDPLDLIPITYNVLTVLQDTYACLADNYLIVTRSQRAKAGLPAPPPVHGAKKGVNPNLKPKTQVQRQQMTPGHRPPTMMVTPSPKGCSTLQGTPAPPVTPHTPRTGTAHSSLKKSPVKAQTPFWTPPSTAIQQKPRIGTGLRESTDSPPKLDFDPEPVASGEHTPVNTAPSRALVPSSGLAPVQRKVPLNIHDLEAAPEMDPALEIPFHETSVEAMFTPPDIKDFSLPPTLQQYTKNQNFIAQTMPRQTEIEGF